MKPALARLLLSALVLGFLLHRVGVASIADVLGTTAGLPLAAAFALYNIGQIASALRWRALARAIGFRTGALRAVRLYFIGMFFGIAIPSTLGNDGIRALHLGREAPGRARALSSVVGDRILGLVTLMGIAAAALALGPRGELPPWLAFGLALLSSATLLGWVLSPTLAGHLPAGNRLRTLVEGDLTPLFRHRGVLLRAVGASLIVHSLHILAQKMLTVALGLDVGLDFIAIYHPLVVLATAIPITIGGFGLREATYALLLPYAGVAADDAVALSLLWWAIGATGGLLGGLFYLGESSPSEAS